MLTFMLYGAFAFLAMPTVFRIIGFNGLLGFFAGFSILGYAALGTRRNAEP